jgi:hypothetical protein
LIFITDSPEKITPFHGQRVYSTSSITLTDSGEILEVRIDGVLYDKIVYTMSSATQALQCGEEVNSG